MEDDRGTASLARIRTFCNKLLTDIQERDEEVLNIKRRTASYELRDKLKRESEKRRMVDEMREKNSKARKIVLERIEKILEISRNVDDGSCSGKQRRRGKADVVRRVDDFVKEITAQEAKFKGYSDGTNKIPQGGHQRGDTKMLSSPSRTKMDDFVKLVFLTAYKLLDKWIESERQRQSLIYQKIYMNFLLKKSETTENELMMMMTGGREKFVERMSPIQEMKPKMLRVTSYAIIFLLRIQKRSKILF